MANILEHKGEKFIIKSIIRPDRINDITIKQLKHIYRADIVIKDNDKYLVLEYLEPANFEDINEYTKEMALPPEHGSQLPTS